MGDGRLAGSMDLGLRDAARAFEEVEIAAFVRLTDMLGEEAVVATRRCALGRNPVFQAVGDGGVGETCRMQAP